MKITFRWDVLCGGDDDDDDDDDDEVLPTSARCRGLSALLNFKVGRDKEQVFI